MSVRFLKREGYVCSMGMCATLRHTRMTANFVLNCEACVCVWVLENDGMIMLMHFKWTMSVDQNWLAVLVDFDPWTILFNSSLISWRTKKMERNGNGNLSDIIKSKIIIITMREYTSATWAEIGNGVSFHGRKLSQNMFMCSIRSGFNRYYSIASSFRFLFSLLL